MGPLLSLRLPQLILALRQTQPTRSSDILINHEPHYVRYIAFKRLEDHRLPSFLPIRIHNSWQCNSICHNILEFGKHSRHCHVYLEELGVSRVISHDGLLVYHILHSKTCRLYIGTITLVKNSELDTQIFFEDGTDPSQFFITVIHLIPPREGKICIRSKAMNKHGHGISSLVNSEQANDGDGPVGRPQDLFGAIGILGQRRAPDHINIEPLQIQVILMGLPYR
mmetsp:Transcript_22205/g.39923  ORF Transcript_22205/g.39923 Transcript_22205/m.39923 type:complete len:224 (+) Transcript_22205:2635-3306(+)